MRYSDFDPRPVCDPYSGMIVRYTDNGMKDGDLPASQEPRPLELDERGLPVGWEVPDGERR